MLGSCPCLMKRRFGFFSQADANIMFGLVHFQIDVFIPLSDEAKKWLPKPGGYQEPFFNLPAPSTICLILSNWVKAAGINKHITFHCARHTFATMMLTLGSDIYTTSKLLGHNHVATTEIYAKVIDKKKFESMSNLDRMFSNKG